MSTNYKLDLSETIVSHLYSKKHVRAYVVAFTVLGALYGFWIGKRSEIAGFLEGSLVFVLFVILANVLVFIIDKTILPPSSEKTDN